jgi:hypothetical protein
VLNADRSGVPCFAQIDENVAREIINHRSLRHPNIIQFIEVRMGNVIWYIVYYSRFLGLIGCFSLGGWGILFMWVPCVFVRFDGELG